jgi:hypothetical protein
VRAPTLALALLLAVPPPAAAQQPAAATPGDPCLMLNNRVLGPRAESRPLPLLRGDPEHGFVPACSAPWSTISPNNQPLPVEGCFKGSLLQLPNNSACGPGTGKLWVGARWVVTTADLAKTQERAAVCQQLETGAWAGTRAFSFECKPRSRELSADQKTDENPSQPPVTGPAAPPAPNPH